MENPILIFRLILLLVLIAFIINIKRIKSNKNLKALLLKLFISILTVIFSWIWFVPMHIGWNGEVPICRFRFQIFENSNDDYGSVPSINDNIFNYRPNRYGRMYLGKRIGKLQEYFTFRIPEERNIYINYKPK